MRLDQINEFVGWNNLAAMPPHRLSILKSKTVQTALTIAVLMALAGTSLGESETARLIKRCGPPPGTLMKPSPYRVSGTP